MKPAFSAEIMNRIDCSTISSHSRTIILFVLILSFLDYRVCSFEFRGVLFLNCRFFIELLSQSIIATALTLVSNKLEFVWSFFGVDFQILVLYFWLFNYFLFFSCWRLLRWFKWFSSRYYLFFNVWTTFKQGIYLLSRFWIS